MSPSSGSILCQNSSQVSGKRFTRLLVYYKRIQLRNSKLKKKCMGKVQGKEYIVSLPSPSAPSSHPLSTFSNLEVLQTPRFRDFYGDFITWKKTIINSVSSLSPFSGGWGNQVEISKVLIMARSFAHQPPIQEPTGSCLIGTNNAPIIQEIQRNLGTLH